MKSKMAKDNNPTMKKGGTSKEEKTTHVDSVLVGKAVSALLTYHNDKVAKKEESSSSLLGNDRAIQVQFGLEVAPSQARKVVPIDIPNSIYQVAKTQDDGGEGLEEPDVCLIVKDESKPWIQEMVEEHSELMGCIKKVLTLDSLRKKHARFQQRRDLLNKYDVFMADDRILPMLTAALGKDFIKAKKLPLPIKITRKVALPFAIQNNLSATYMTICNGTSITIRAGNTGMPEKKLIENVVAIAENAVSKIPRKWANIRSIAIKTPDSTSLPFFHRLPEELIEIAKLAGVAPAFDASMDDNKSISEGEGKTKEDDDADNESPKRKRELAAKSPLVRALKKQKKETKEGSKTKKAKSTKHDAKKGSKSPAEGKKKTKIEKEDVTPKKTEASEEAKSPKAAKKKELSNDKAVTKNESKSDKKKRKESESAADTESSKEDAKSPKRKSKNADNAEFVASKKFKGSKEGYVFRKGDQGVGYYLDKKPVVDKMVLQALIRSGSKGGGAGKGKRSRSVGKKRGGR